MIPVLDAEAMREADRVTIQELGLPSLVLMEQAAGAVTDAVLARFDGAEPIVVVCGPGNNGGDGLAVARQLRVRGAEVAAVLPDGPGRLGGDAALQFNLASRFGVPIECPAPAELPQLLGRAGLIIDALFGTGLARPLGAPWSDTVDAINGATAPVVAVDIPSGLAGGDPRVVGPVVEATLTVTFGAPKVAHVLPPGCWLCGEVAVADIGIPPWVIRELATLELVEPEDVAGWLPTRLPDSHKGHFGHLVVVSGRFGRAGAAILTAKAAVMAGAGLVTVATARSAVTAIQAQVPEAMVDGLAEDGEGICTGDGLGPVLAKASAVAVGPGLGIGEGPRRVVSSILRSWKGPLVLDADALTLVADNLEEIVRSGATVLTPHPGELGRLLGVETAEAATDRAGCACRLSKASGAVVAAKGARTVIAAPGGVARVIPTGSPGLATGGSGDVLTGVIGALLAQGLDAGQAAAAGAFLHGLAGELAGEAFPGAVPAGSLPEYLPEAEARVRGCS